MYFFNAWDGILSFLFPLVFAAGILAFVIALVRSLREWGGNNRSPKLEVEAGVVAKRADVRHTMQNTGDVTVTRTTSSTTYFVTFQVHSGDRMELRVPARDFGLIAEGDFGMLTFQGTRFLGFRRT